MFQFGLQSYDGTTLGHSTQEAVDCTERENRFKCRETWAAPKHMTVTRRSLESSLSDRCANTQDPGAQSKKQTSQHRVCHRTRWLMQKCADQSSWGLSSLPWLRSVPVLRREKLEAGNHRGPASFIKQIFACTFWRAEYSKGFSWQNGLSRAHRLFLPPS